MGGGPYNAEQMKWPLQSDHLSMLRLFGNPDGNGDGEADPLWVTQHLTTIVPPYPMTYAGSPVGRITVNRACAPNLLGALQDIAKLGPAFIAKYRLGVFGGMYNFRSKRLSIGLSLHAYAAAIDIDPQHNLQGQPGGSMPAQAVAVFKQHGATWGGDWSPRSRDPMHFQWART